VAGAPRHAAGEGKPGLMAPDPRPGARDYARFGSMALQSLAAFPGEKRRTRLLPASRPSLSGLKGVVQALRR